MQNKKTRDKVRDRARDIRRVTSLNPENWAPSPGSADEQESSDGDSPSDVGSHELPFQQRRGRSSRCFDFVPGGEEEERGVDGPWDSDGADGESLAELLICERLQQAHNNCGALDFQGCEFEEIPSALSLLTRPEIDRAEVKTLVLGFNEIRTVDQMFSESALARQLETLELFSNQIEAVSPELLRNASALCALVLNNNVIESMDCLCQANSQLVKLDLHSNCIVAIPVSTSTFQT